MTELPHTPYITAVIDALTIPGLEPDSWWMSDAEIDPYVTGEDAGCTSMLTAVLVWNDTCIDEDGLLLFWDHPAGHWQYARPRPDGGNTQPEFLPHLGLYSDPGAVAGTVANLLAKRPLSEEDAPYCDPADAVREAVEAWSAA